LIGVRFASHGMLTHTGYDKILIGFSYLVKLSVGERADVKRFDALEWQVDREKRRERK